MKITLFHPDFNNALSGTALDGIRKKAAIGAEQEIKAWYRHLPEDWFDNPDPFPDGSPRHQGARTFAQALSSDWHSETEEKGFSLLFKRSRKGGSPWGLRLQQYGGVIRPKEALALTIPVTAKARGLRASVFSESVHRLFRVGKPQGDKRGTLAWQDDAGGLHAAYVLRRRSEVPPLRQRRGHDALPRAEELASRVRPYFLAALHDVMENLGYGG